MVCFIVDRDNKYKMMSGLTKGAGSILPLQLVLVRKIIIIFLLVATPAGFPPTSTALRTLWNLPVTTPPIPLNLKYESGMTYRNYAGFDIRFIAGNDEK
jgi:hypothetical protein